MELANQLKKMMAPNKWKNTPFLPMRRQRPGKEEELGFLYRFKSSSKNLRPDVYLGSMYHPNKKAIPLTPSEVSELSCLCYKSFTDLLLDGWEVINSD